MSSFLINIIATSNLAKELNKDTAAVEANTLALNGNTAALKLNGVASEKVTTSRRKGLRYTKYSENSYVRFGQKVANATSKLLGLDRAQNAVGYNIMGLSIRIGAWFVPMMAAMYTSMLPVIAGLLAIGSAAGVASLGLIGVLGVGAAALYKQMSGGNGYAGPRRPYTASTQQESIVSVLLKPLSDTIGSPEIEGQIATSVAFLKYTFGTTLPDAFKSFIGNIDIDAMKMIMSMFSSWLPRAAKSTAEWGSSLVKIIGAGSLERVNNLFKWIAGGIMNTADWLANGGGWDHIDDITTLLGDVIHALNELGKSALPVFVDVLQQIWPNPLKPIIENLTRLFRFVANSPNLLAFIEFLIKIGVVMVSLKAIGSILLPIINGITWAWKAISSIGASAYFADVIMTIVWFIGSLGTLPALVVAGIIALVGAIVFGIVETIARLTRDSHPWIGSMWTNFKTFFHNIFAKIFNLLIDTVNWAARKLGVPELGRFNEYQYITPEQYQRGETRNVIEVHVAADEGTAVTAIKNELNKGTQPEWMNLSKTTDFANLTWG